jgi:hypothetical protein
MPTSSRCVILSFVLKSKLFHLNAKIGVSQHFAVSANKNSGYLMKDKTLYTCTVLFCNFFGQGQSMLKGRENLCDKEGKMLHGSSTNKASNMIQNETSYWTDKESRGHQDICFSLADGLKG